MDRGRKRREALGTGRGQGCTTGQTAGTQEGRDELPFNLAQVQKEVHLCPSSLLSYWTMGAIASGLRVGTVTTMLC